MALLARVPNRGNWRSLSVIRLPRRWPNHPVRHTRDRDRSETWASNREIRLEASHQRQDQGQKHETPRSLLHDSVLAAIHWNQRDCLLCHHRPRDQRRLVKGHERSCCWLYPDCVLACYVPSHVSTWQSRSSTYALGRVCGSLDCYGDLHCWHCRQHVFNVCHGSGVSIHLRDLLWHVLEQYSLVVCSGNHSSRVATCGFFYCCLFRMAMDICKHFFSRLSAADTYTSQVIALITPYAIDTAGWKFYILFCVMIFLNIPFVYFFLPEVHFHSPDYSLLGY